MAEYEQQRSGVDRRKTPPPFHCPEHELYHETLARVATNTDWIIRALKVGGSIFGGAVTIIIIPTYIWLATLDKRITNVETRLTLHITPETKK